VGPRPQGRLRRLGGGRQCRLGLQLRLAPVQENEDWEGGASALRGAAGPIRVERVRNLHPVAAALIDAGRSYGMPYLDDMNTFT
jgi:choline dehydrogenase-like flavoprotein